MAERPSLLIKTDNKWRQFKYRDEVPARVLSTTLDWTKEDDTDGYFKYKNYWYHLSQFTKTDVVGWDGMHGDSFFSGILIKLSSDGERYKVALYMA